MWLDLNPVFLLLFDRFSITAWSILIITFLIPRRYFALYIWCFLVLLTIFYFPNSMRYTDRGVADDFGEAVFHIFTSLVFFSIMIRTALILGRVLMIKNNQNNRQTSIEFKLISRITFIAYGILAAYHICLFFTNVLEGERPAWKAYSIVALITILIFKFFQFNKNYSKSQRNVWIKNLHFFGYTLYLTIIPLVILSFSFSIFALIETNKIVKKYAEKSDDREVKYCIQKKLDAWLDLTPLTTWNKPYATTNHAVLVIQTSNVTDLYNWSYKLRRWEHITSGFSSSSFSNPSSLECILDRNYSKTLPFLFPKPVQHQNKK
jgi:hypothetical protein